MSSGVVQDSCCPEALIWPTVSAGAEEVDLHGIVERRVEAHRGGGVHGDVDGAEECEPGVVKAEAVSDDDGPPTPPTPAPVLCYCERPAALLDGRWVCAQLVEGDFCICGREDEADSD